MNARLLRVARLGLLLLTLTLSLLLATGPAFGWGGCDHKADRSAAIDTTDAKRIVIEARAGDLDVRGVAGTQIKARGTACADKSRDLDEVRIVTERHGDEVRVIAEIPETSWNDSAWLDLKIEVPADVPLEIHDSSGDMDVRGATLARLDDSSGDVNLHDTRGDFTADDSSGDFYLTGHHGDVTVSDSSGDLRLRDVEGSVLVERDSSGDISADRISGSVVVRSDSSGDIRVSDVGGDFEVGRDGSGDIDYRDVRGRVDVPTDR